jgi:hypothetical protein
VIGIALLLSGLGFIILALGAAFRRAAQPQTETERQSSA